MKNIDELKHDHHFHVSVVKSALRIIACLLVLATNTDGLAAAALLFALAELLGIGEELV